MLALQSHLEFATAKQVPKPVAAGDFFLGGGGLLNSVFKCNSFVIYYLILTCDNFRIIFHLAKIIFLFACIIIQHTIITIYNKSLTDK